MILIQLFLTRRIRLIAITTLFLWCSLLNFPRRYGQVHATETQALTLWKPCFAETDELSSPPLSQTGLSNPSLWLDKEIHSDVIQYSENPSLGDSAGQEAVEPDVDEEIEEQLETQKSNQSSTESTVSEVNEEIEEQLEEKKLNNLPPIDRVESKNSMLKTWFVENPKFPQFSYNKLVTLVVDRHQWQAERYMGQYVFINRFGTTAREYDYNVRVCNDKGETVGYFFCPLEESQTQSEEKPRSCISLRSDGFRLRDFRRFDKLESE